MDAEYRTVRTGVASHLIPTINSKISDTMVIDDNNNFEHISPTKLHSSSTLSTLGTLLGQL